MARKRDSGPDPNKLVRVTAGRYRSEDDRFAVSDGGTGWFVTDAAQVNEFGQELVTGPFATLKAVRDALPEARRTTLRPLPVPKSAPDMTSKSRRSATKRPKPVATPSPPPEHRLVKLLRDAARDRFPPSDLGVEILGSPPGPADAVVAFSGHSIIAAAFDPDEIRTHLPGEDPGAPMSGPFLTWLGLQLGSPPGSLDVVLVADGSGTPRRDHPTVEVDEGPERFAGRIERARAHRTEVRLFTDEDGHGVLIVGLGLGGRREVSVEVDPRRRGRGIGVGLARAALGLVPEGEPLFAQVAPGNVASLRAFLRAGYRPIGSEVLFLRGR